MDNVYIKSQKLDAVKYDVTIPVSQELLDDCFDMSDILYKCFMKQTSFEFKPSARSKLLPTPRIVVGR